MRPETLISDHLYRHEISFHFEDNAFNPSLEVEKKSFLKLMNLLKDELSYFWLLDISAFNDPKNSDPVLIYHLLNMEVHRRLRIKVRCGEEREIPSIVHLWANANWYEKELFDFWGVRAGHNTSRLILPMSFIGHPLQDQDSIEKPNEHLARDILQAPLQAKTKKKFAVGNFRSTEFPENGYVENRFRLDGMKIVEAKLLFGFEHQGIEKLCEGKSCVEAMAILEKINVSQAPLFAQLWCALLEEVFKIEATDRSQVLRMIMSEMVRIQDHLKTFSMMTRLLGSHGHGHLLGSLYEQMCSLTCIMCPGRDYFRSSCPGGMLRDIPLHWRGECLNTLSILERELFSWKRVMLHSVTLKERLLRDNISGREALALGLSGPVLRACGINYDIRKATPYYFYNQVDFEVPLGLNGSAYDRFLVRLEEIEQSIRIIYQLLDNLPVGENFDSEVAHLIKSGNTVAAWMNFFKNRNPLEREIYLAQEGPSGELGYYLNIDENNKINRLKIHTPSFHHAQAYEKLIVGFDIDDFPLLQGSFNFSMGEVER